MRKQIERLQDPAVRRQMADEILASRSEPDAFERVLIAWAAKGTLKPYEGRKLSEIAGERGVEPVEALFDVLVEDDCRTQCILFSMSEENLERILSWDFVMVASDGDGLADHGPACAGRPHPRSFGTPGRFLRRFVREKKLLTLEQAIHKLTGQPAQRFGLLRRGVVRKGAHADLVVFDADTVTDRATFKNPFQHCEGIEHVIVNGRFALRDGKLTGQAPGRLLRCGDA